MSVVPLRHADSSSPELAIDLRGTTDVRDLIPGAEWVVADIAFDDDRWNLEGHPDWKDSAGKNTKINFLLIPPRWREFSKYWTLASLSPLWVQEWADPEDAYMWESYKEAIKVATAQGNVKLLGHGLARLEANNIYSVGTDEWDTVTATFLKPLTREEGRTTKRIAGSTAKGRADQLRSIDVFGVVAGWDRPFGSVPWGDADLKSVFGTKKADGKAAENAVQATEYVGHALGMAAFVLDNLADNIVEHVEWWVTTHQQNRQACPSTRGEGQQQAAALLVQLANEHDGRVPGSSTRDSIAQVALAYTLGLEDKTEAFQWFRQGARDASKVIDLVPDPHVSPCPVPIKGLADQSGGLVPWCDRLLWDRSELHWWVSLAVYSSALYLAATLGLRDNDRDLLAPNCVKARTVLHDGVPVELSDLHAHLEKNRQHVVPTTFPAGGRVQRAVDVVERLYGLLVADGSTTPIGRKRLFDFQLNIGSVRGGRQGIHLDGPWVSTWIVQAAKRLTRAGVIDNDLNYLPDRMSDKQIRITTLQAYASRPLGMILAAAIGKWTGGAAVMGGYVGTILSDIVLPDPDDVEEIEAVASAAALANAARRDAEGDYPEDAPGTARRREDLRRYPDIANEEPLNKRQATAMGRRALHVEVGPLTTCFFRSEGALCGGQGRADFRRCQPGSCRNSSQARWHRAKYEWLRRRSAERNNGLTRGAAKIEMDSPSLAAEFADVDDDELTRIIIDEVRRDAETFLEILHRA